MRDSTATTTGVPSQLHKQVKLQTLRQEKRSCKTTTLFAAFLSDVKWTGGRVAARSRTPRVRCNIDVYCFKFLTCTRILFTRLFDCFGVRLPKEIVLVHVFLYDVSSQFTCSDFADSSLTGGCARDKLRVRFLKNRRNNRLVWVFYSSNMLCTVT